MKVATLNKASDGVSTTSHAVAVSLKQHGLEHYILHTLGTVREVTGGADEANTTNLDTMITSTDNGDTHTKLASGSSFGHQDYS